MDVPTNPSIDSTVYDCGGSGNTLVVIPVCPGLQVKAIPARVIGSPALNGWGSFVFMVTIPVGSW